MQQLDSPQTQRTQQCRRVVVPTRLRELQRRLPLVIKLAQIGVPRLI